MHVLGSILALKVGMARAFTAYVPRKAESEMGAPSNKLFDFFSSFLLNPRALDVDEFSLFSNCLRCLLCLKSLD